MGIICLYMLFVIIAACLCGYVQTLGKVYIGQWSTFISNGKNFRYNYIIYFIGFVLFFGVMIMLYKMLIKKHLETTVLYRGDKIFAIIVTIIGCVIMFASLVFESLLLFGMTDNIGPEVLVYMTVIGFPMGTMGYLILRLSMDM